MNEQEKEIQKYKEQGRGKKKKGQIAAEPEKYKIGEILELMEGPLNSVACLADKGFKCDRKKSCQTLPMWVEFDKMVHDFFYHKTLKDLIG